MAYSFERIVGGIGTEEDSVRFAHFGPSQRFQRGLLTTCLRRAPPPARVEATEKL